MNRSSTLISTFRNAAVNTEIPALSRIAALNSSTLISSSEAAMNIATGERQPEVRTIL